MTIQKRYAKAYEALIEGVEVDNEGDDPVTHIYDKFIADYNWNIERVGFHKALTEWLQGLALNIPYTNYDIMNTFGITEDKLQSYFPFMAMRLSELFRDKGLVS